MKLEKLVIHEDSLQRLSKIAITDAQLSWDLAEALESVQKHVKKFHDTRNDLIKKYGTVDPEDPNKFVVLDKREILEAEVKKLAEVSVKMTFPKVPISAFNGAGIAPADLIAWKDLQIVTGS